MSTTSCKWANEPQSVLGTPHGELILCLSLPSGEQEILRYGDKKITFGSDLDCTCPIAAPNVAAVECSIFRGAERTVVRCWSAGARLNGSPFHDADLHAGDRLQIGGHQFEVLSLARERATVSQRPNATHPRHEPSKSNDSPSQSNAPTDLLQELLSRLARVERLLSERSVAPAASFEALPAEPTMPDGPSETNLHDEAMCDAVPQPSNDRPNEFDNPRNRPADSVAPSLVATVSDEADDLVAPLDQDTSALADGQDNPTMSHTRASDARATGAGATEAGAIQAADECSNGNAPGGEGSADEDVEGHSAEDVKAWKVSAMETTDLSDIWQGIGKSTSSGNGNGHGKENGNGDGEQDADGDFAAEVQPPAWTADADEQHPAVDEFSDRADLAKLEVGDSCDWLVDDESPGSCDESLSADSAEKTPVSVADILKRLGHGELFEEEVVDNDAENDTENDAVDNTDNRTGYPRKDIAEADEQPVDDAVFEAEIIEDPHPDRPAAESQSAFDPEQDNDGIMITDRDNHDRELGSDDESINDYMAGLLARMGGTPAPATGAQIDLGEASENTNTAHSPIDDEATESPSARKPAALQSDLQALLNSAEREGATPRRRTNTKEQVEFTPRRPCPEGGNELRAMRELANVSARCAIQQFDTKRSKADLWSKIGIAIVGTACAALMAYWTMMHGQLSMLLGAFSGSLVAIVWGTKALRLRARLHRTRRQISQALA